MLPHEQFGISPSASKNQRTPAEVAAGLKTVTMVFTRPVELSLTHWETVLYPAGTHEVPEVLSTHWYLLACGAIVQAAE
jgi:hypothetical protein